MSKRSFSSTDCLPVFIIEFEECSLIRNKPRAGLRELNYSTGYENDQCVPARVLENQRLHLKPSRVLPDI